MAEDLRNAWLQSLASPLGVDPVARTRLSLSSLESIFVVVYEEPPGCQVWSHPLAPTQLLARGDPLVHISNGVYEAYIPSMQWHNALRYQ